MDSRIKKIIRLIVLLVIVDMVCFFKITGAEEAVKSSEEETGTIKEGAILPHAEVKIKTVVIDYFMKMNDAVAFDHEKHSEALKIKCKDCHHKKAEGEKAAQTKCSNKACHAKVQEKDGKKFDAGTGSATENPFHVLCMNCHKKYVNDSTKKAPAKCKSCHSRRKDKKRH